MDELSLPCSSSSESFWAVASDSSQNSFVQSTCAMNKMTIRIRSSWSCCGLDCTINVCNENEQNDNKNQLGGLLKKCKNINTPKFIANTKENIHNKNFLGQASSSTTKKQYKHIAENDHCTTVGSLQLSLITAAVVDVVDVCALYLPLFAKSKSHKHTIINCWVDLTTKNNTPQINNAYRINL